jgi:hypothetical protein
VARRPVRRPTLYTEARAGEFCAALAGGATVQQAAEAVGVKSASTIFEWLGRHEAFAAMYRAAQRARTFALAEEILRIADTPLIGSQTKTRGEVTETVQVDMTAHRKLQIDTRKWLLAKMNPRDFGETQEEAAAGDGADGALQVLSAEPMSEAEWQEKYGPDLGAAAGTAKGAD